MVNESRNNSSGWKSRLEALDSLSGELFNKDAAWEKLHQRLREKRPAKKAVWYWSAAACLLLAFSISWIFSVKKEASFVENNSFVNNNLHPKQSKQTFLPLKEIFKKDMPEAAGRQHFYSKRRKPFIAKVNKIILPATNNILADKPVLNNIGTNLPPIANKVIAADTLQRVIAKAAYKQKLRVIYINELEHASQAVEKFALNTRATLRVKITNKDIFSDFSTGTNSEHNILKINLSPQN